MGIISAGKTIFRNLDSWTRLQVAAGKAARRLLRASPSGDQRRATEWAASRVVSWERIAEDRDPSLWREATDFASALREESRVVLRSQKGTLGGGGAYGLLYFLVRLTKPTTVVETGVAAGWSSRAILEAQKANGIGRLWSSDFPYLRNVDPLESIGCLVPEELRSDWRLFTDGDRRNLPRIIAECGPIDLFHYDSDKSYQGRTWALRQVLPRLSKTGIIIMDDVQDNMHFADFVRSHGCAHLLVESEGKYAGVAFFAGNDWLLPSAPTRPPG